MYTNSDWRSDKDTRRSITGVLILTQCPVNWISKHQPIVTVSSPEAEYPACFYAIQDIVWIRQLHEDNDLKRTRQTKVFINNRLACQLAMYRMHRQRSKHIQIKYQWVRDMVASKAIKLIHVSTTKQHADFLTKTLPGGVFWRHAVAIMHACGID